MYQRIIIIGNIGSDAELRYLPDGTPVCTFSLADSRVVKKGVDETTWFRMTRDVSTDIKTPSSIENTNPDYYKQELASRDALNARIAELKELLDTESQLSNQFYLLLVDNPKSKKLADDLIEALRINGKEVQE